MHGLLSDDSMRVGVSLVKRLETFQLFLQFCIQALVHCVPASADPDQDQAQKCANASMVNAGKCQCVKLSATTTTMAIQSLDKY